MSDLPDFMLGSIAFGPATLPAIIDKLPRQAASDEPNVAAKEPFVAANAAIVAPPPPFVPGIFDDMPAETYFAIEAMSQSGAKKIRQSQLHYLVDRKTKKAPTEAMVIGTAIHDRVLEPGSFDARVVCAPKFDRRYKEQKVAAEAFERDNAARICLKPEDYDMVLRCGEAIFKHPAARSLLEGATVERSMFWIDARYKVPCKARIDARNNGLLIDVKSCDDASPEGFAKQIANYEYHAQGAHYISAEEHLLDASPQGFVFIAVEKQPPHAVACYLLPGEGVLAGGHLMNIALARYAEALASGEFRGYADTIEQIRLPRWLLRFDN